MQVHDECGTELDSHVTTHNSVPGGEPTSIVYRCPLCNESWVVGGQ